MDFHHRTTKNRPEKNYLAELILISTASVKSRRMLFCYRWTPRFVSLLMTAMLILGSLSRHRLFIQARRQQSTSTTTTFKTIRAHVIHRHGDRTPITPLSDEDYWRKMLISKEVADKIATNTKVLQSDESTSHAASGRGPFGKLTELGLLQMIQVGNTLRDRFAADQTHLRIDGSKLAIGGLGEVQPADLHIYCTDFQRTIQSVQGLLLGLFPEPDNISTSSSTSNMPIAIDTRHTTRWMIPDPQPRQSAEQSTLERTLSARPHILQREQELRPLALIATKALHKLLASDAHEISFGVDGQDANADTNGPDSDTPSQQEEIELQPLGWNQLAEITKCLAVRNLLPAGITEEHVEAISKHAAWRWFENLSDPRLIHLAMHTMARAITDALMMETSSTSSTNKRLTIWSAHDSTLIGILCAFRLQMPAVWPEYASSIVVELVEASSSAAADDKQYYVRFSLNGEQLNCDWEGEQVMDMISLSMLSEKIGKKDLASDS